MSVMRCLWGATNGGVDCGHGPGDRAVRGALFCEIHAECVEEDPDIDVETIRLSLVSAGLHARPMLGGTFCMLDDGHKGRCSSVAFYCDGCGKRRRSRPASTMVNPADGVVEGEFCFMCVSVLDTPEQVDRAEWGPF